MYYYWLLDFEMGDNLYKDNTWVRFLFKVLIFIHLKGRMALKARKRRRENEKGRKREIKISHMPHDSQWWARWQLGAQYCMWKLVRAPLDHRLLPPGRVREKLHQRQSKQDLTSTLMWGLRPQATAWPSVLNTSVGISPDHVQCQTPVSNATCTKSGRKKKTIKIEIRE